jgi:hypothetical protein
MVAILLMKNPYLDSYSRSSSSWASSVSRKRVIDSFSSSVRCGDL